MMFCTFDYVRETTKRMTKCAKYYVCKILTFVCSNCKVYRLGVTMRPSTGYQVEGTHNYSLISALNYIPTFIASFSVLSTVNFRAWPGFCKCGIFAKHLPWIPLNSSTNDGRVATTSPSLECVSDKRHGLNAAVASLHFHACEPLRHRPSVMCGYIVKWLSIKSRRCAPSYVIARTGALTTSVRCIIKVPARLR